MLEIERYPNKQVTKGLAPRPVIDSSSEGATERNTVSAFAPG
jgi:hypothetical protein